MPQSVRDRPDCISARRRIAKHFSRVTNFASCQLGARTVSLAVVLAYFSITSIAAGQTEADQGGPAEVAQHVEPLMSETPIPTKNLLQVLRDGGPMMIPIGLCSFLLMVFAFERVVSLRRGRVIPKPFVERFLSQLRERELDRESAFELCEENRSPVSEVFAAAVKKWGRPSVEIEQAVIDAGERVTTELRKYLRLFNGICTISPMLGLLGTVFGMISSFNSIATSNAMGRPDLLASGIGEALLTTAAGLCVAIPAMVAYLFFVGRVDQLIISIDALSQDVVELIASDTWHKEDEQKSKKRAA